MDKRVLVKVPRPEPMPASEKYKKGDCFITTEEMTINDEQVLIMNFFGQARDSTELICTSRTFLSPTDYITQDLTTPKTKWKKGAFHNNWDFQRLNKQFVSMEHMDRFRKFLRGYECSKSWKIHPDIWDDCEEYQSKVLSLRLDKKHQVEKDAIDSRMSVLGDIPEGFYDWIHDDALRKSQYIFFYPIKGKSNMVSCACSVCKQRFEADRRIIGAKNDEKGECPKCSSSVTFKSFGKLASRKRDSVYATYIDPTPEGFCVRSFLAQRIYKKEWIGVYQEPDKVMEISRDFVGYGEDSVARWACYQYDDFKNTHEMRWCEGRVHNSMYGGTTLYECYNSCLYPGNLPEAWEHTPMKYSGLEILSRKTPGWPARYWDAIVEPERYRALEILIKADFCRMSHGMIEYGKGTWGGGRGLDYDGTDLKSILGLNISGKNHQNAQNIRKLQQIDATEPQLVIMQHLDRLGVNVKADVIVRFYNIFRVHSDLLPEKNRKASLHKICRYIEGVWEKNKRKAISDIGKDWIDYIEWCEALKINLDDEFHYFPPDFYKAHDEVSKQYKIHQDAVKAEEKRLEEIKAKRNLELAKEAMAEIFKANENADAFNIRGKGLILVIPKNAQDIRDEGEALHHCVGSYVDRVAKGTTNIFFVRRQEAPDVPYFTMEFKDGKVIQCRGNRNCSMPPEVEAFTMVFEEKMSSAIKKEVVKHAG